MIHQIILALLSLMVWVQSESTPHELEAAWPDPDQPGLLILNQPRLGLDVRGENRASIAVIVPACSHPAPRLVPSSLVNGLELEFPDDCSHRKNLRILVPFQTHLKLTAKNGGILRVQGVQGDHEVSNIGSHIKMYDISGSVVARIQKADIEVAFSRPAQRAMSFIAYKGSVQLTLPDDAAFDLAATISKGDFHSELPLKRLQSRPPVDRRRLNQGGATLSVTINTGDLKIKAGSGSQ